MKRSESFSPSLFISCSQFAAIRMTHFYDSADLTRGVAAVQQPSLRATGQVAILWTMPHAE
jgi:hypothetical protein